ncbi:retropepsin-like aspartic protease family protein [Erythrobacter aureus]|uniref:TIGR02281 family clan AA aspartic protease n=1 Tax=Erythrobacter aureus TaxID=2182384 RepID=A0A345YGD9_9SPHN|nr:TIGR02281 family clan AA aspartic protease [Erythrobacter aureus]AXK42991.1 TIGR02281 family clan AA aspartic protease [Erythrobacter aureus]
MDLEPVFQAVADTLRAIPRSELLIAALAAMALGWIGAVVARRSALGGILRIASSLALGLILLTVVLQLSRFDPRFDVAVPQIGLPEQMVEGGETRIPLSADGHFWVRAEVNGVPGNFMIDTGATLTAISAPLAERAGLEPRRGGIPIMLGTANGTVQAHVATVDSLTFGNVSASGTDAAIAESFGDFNVIGMNVLARLGSWRVEDNTLILVPAPRIRFRKIRRWIARREPLGLPSMDRAIALPAPRHLALCFRRVPWRCFSISTGPWSRSHPIPMPSSFPRIWAIG